MKHLGQDDEEHLGNSYWWYIFTRNLRAFTLHVGCPRRHYEPCDNIKELRLFHSSQMPFFQKLQNDLQTQITLNNQQQEIITALVFRHLTEQLPGLGNGGNSTQRWQNFWKDAFRKEFTVQEENMHPLPGLLNKLCGEGKKNRVVNEKGEIMEGVETGQKGQVFRIGQDLFGTLSTSIHMYKGGAKNSYTVRDDQWGEQYRNLFRALKPTDFKDDGEVNWEAERARYL